HMLGVIEPGAIEGARLDRNQQLDRRQRPPDRRSFIPGEGIALHLCNRVALDDPIGGMPICLIPYPAHLPVSSPYQVRAILTVRSWSAPPVRKGCHDLRHLAAAVNNITFPRIPRKAPRIRRVPPPMRRCATTPRPNSAE